MGNIQLREFSKLEYGNPRGFLIKLREVELLVALSNLPNKIRTLRTNGLKVEREMRAAAIFCVGMSKHIGHEILFSPVEQQDYDFVTTWLADGTRHYAPVQLKEFVPHELNQQTSLQTIIDSLSSKYVDSENLTVAIHLNRQFYFDPQSLTFLGNLVISSLWTFGTLTEDQSKWRLSGDFLKQPDERCFVDFDYPQ